MTELLAAADAATWRDRDAELISPAYHRYSDLVVESAEGAHLHTVDGRDVLDFGCGIGVTNLGHRHPAVVAAVHEQVDRLWHTSVTAYHPQMIEAAAAIVSVTPPSLDQVFLTNSGAEAVEGAMKLARRSTGRSEIIAFVGGFHGRTYGALSLTASKATYRRGMGPLLPGIHHIRYPYCFRYCTHAKDAACDLVERELQLLFSTTVAPDTVAAIIVEPVQGEGGVVPPASFMPMLRKVCDEHGILLVADEVQSGFGRTGRMFAVEHTGVEPDIMCLAKALGNGMPIAAFVARHRVMHAFHEGEHGTTYGGNAVACAAAVAVIATMTREKIPERAERLGRTVMERARGWQADVPALADVRGLGMMIGLEFMHNGASATDLVNRISANALERGVLLLSCGIDGNVIRLIPPLTIPETELHAGLDILEAAMRGGGGAVTAVGEAIDTGNLIGGAYRPSTTGRTFESRNPAHTADLVGVFPRSDAADVDSAVAVARTAFESWRSTPWPARAAIILRASELLEDRKEEIARLMTREMGKVLTEARGDVQEAIDMGKFIAGEGRRAYGETVPSELREKWAMTMRQPFGVVGCITPWNFPIAIPSWKIFPAVMAGNTVVLKPAEDTPLCALRFVEVLEAAELPAGVVNVVFGFGEEAGAPLVEHPDVAAIYFTGSVATGRIVSETCGRMLKKCSLELGGKNAIVVLEDADIELAVDGALWGAFGTSGQRCTASSRLIVERGALDGFTSRLVERASALRLGDGLDAKVDVGPVINETQLKRIHSYSDIGREEGASLLLGGEIATDGDLANGWFYRPTVFADVRSTMRIAQEEIFGPTTVIMPVSSVEEAITAANSTQYGLSLSVYTNDLRTAFHAIHELHSGIVYINAPTIGAEIQLPFGGTRNTGNGHREAGGHVLDEFSEWKSIYIDYSGRLQRAQIDTE